MEAGGVADSTEADEVVAPFVPGDVAEDVLAVDRIHASTVVDRNLGLSLTFTAIPRNAIPGGAPEGLPDVVGALQGEGFVELPRPAASFLPHAVACLLLDVDPDAAADRLKALLNRPAWEGMADIDQGILAFSEFCSFTPIVPIEESRIDKKVMAQIVGFGGAVGLAALATGPIIVAVGAAAGTVVVLSTAVGVGELIYDRIAPSP